MALRLPEDARRRPRGERSIVEIASDLFGNLADLLESEIGLLRTEAAEKTSRAAWAGLFILTGALLALAALLFALGALAALLMEAGMSAAGAALLVAALVGIAAAGALYCGLRRLRADGLMPKKTIDELKRDTETLKENI
ncbi:phage holin family protein [Tepidicaulis sp. LMO-SS28]|uniref:phage holin family protein n=1 Tax=Tepidicaulis sp. LMO-SS28 TaxID=3447455 RepID=UPI003EE312CC